MTMENNRNIAFGYSTTCNVKCDHCVAADDSSSNAKMDFDKAKAIIEEMACCNVNGISFTAGEPLLFLNDICDLIRLCKNNGIYTRVVTNGFWAKTREHSDMVVSTLLLSGLSQLRISFSRWHQKNIDAGNIIKAASSCKKMGLDYFISFITDFSKNDDKLETFLRNNHIKFFPEPLIYFGRAEEFNRPEVFTDYCPNICQMNPYLTPELDMFACCDAGSHFTRTGFFYIGNRKGHTLDEMFRKKESNPLYNLIGTMGLTHMASFLGFNASDIVKCRKCELCEKLFNSVENLSALEKAASTDLKNWAR